jgi:hypothetical protein
MSGRGRGRRPTVAKKDEVTETATDEKPKRQNKKKQFSVVAIVGPDGIEGNLLPEIKRPLIVHLPIQSKDVIMNDIHIAYDPHPPADALPYDIYADNPFFDNAEQLELKNEQSVKNEISVRDVVINTDKKDVEHVSSNAEIQIDYYNLKSSLLVQFKDTTETKTIPLTSDSACLWCCHTFNSRPVVLPIRDTGEYLEITGNFCSPECACAHLFDIRQDSHTRWEQLALLYRVYGEACQGKIHPAPARSVLKLFGGNLSITEYRNIIRSQKLRVDIHLPPMVSILTTMDTKPIDFYDASLTKGVTETVKERLQKAEEVLRLRRTKPLKAWESTLDACINLKIKN